MSSPAPLRLALAGIAGGLAALGVYAAAVEPRRLEVRRKTIHVRGLPDDLEGLRIALLSDFHAGRLTPWSVLRRAAEAAMRTQPHLIALTGDFVDRSPDDLDRAMDAIRELWAPLGAYAVPGNHDHAVGAIEQWRRAIAGHRTLEDLTNRYVLVRHGEATLCVAGTDDLEEGSPRLRLPPPDLRDLTILLAHNPDQAERSRREDDAVDLILSGHTHGGQVRLPSVGALHRKSPIYDHGLRRRPWTQVYTSRGIGTTFLPVRLGAPPEVALLELTGRPREVW
ncbi:MAG: metallophosphoesterase [Gemmatimonadetes bacterium]|nr:metallophosphoesterase [Gemmatimonadota bacterium]NIQ53287.1 metallophosphoesterase [Gemmatimonadota bacterium]NIU73425.1 metallophosphoesterase [Gammaproteobacteria bacterium]NIX43660.1 metallophosphoesterase [Gemmatimonadota bacterium]NIY07851.1 metallophosphoesterase [Gemmatimonadota bacterium]